MATAEKSRAKKPSELLEIENIGPIKSVSVSVPKSGGLVVFRGRNGAGKSTAISAVEAALGSGPKLKKRDGSLGSGSVDTPWGVSVRVGQSTRRSGELEISVLDDEFSIVDLVDPREKDKAAADRRRLKALLRVAGATASAELFRRLFRDDMQFLKIVDQKSLESIDDVVQMAAAVKRDAESHARLIEQQRDTMAADAAAIEKSMEGVDLTQDLDLDSLKSKHESAIKYAAILDQRLAVYKAALGERERLQGKIAAAKSQAAVPVSELVDEYAKQAAISESIHAEVADVLQKIEELNRIRESLQSRFALVCEKCATLKARISEAQASESALQELQERLDKSMEVTEVTDSQVSAAKTEVESLRSQMTDAEILLRSRSQLQRLEQCRESLGRLEKESEELRGIAKGTDEVLTDLVGGLGTPIRVGTDDNGNARLIVDHADRGETYFSELSKGEKLAIVAKIAIRAAGKGGAFTIPQEFYEGLDPANRKVLVELLTGSEVLGLTAECSDGPLVAEVLQ